MKNPKFLMLLTLLAVVIMVGCSKNYVITTPLDSEFPRGEACAFGEFTDALPADMAIEDKPSQEDISKLKSYLVEKLSNKGLLEIYYNEKDVPFKIQGEIIEFKKGSGFLRFLVGFGAGSAKLLTHLELVDANTSEVIFGGNFKGNVSDWSEDGAKIFEQVAEGFAKALEKEAGKYEMENR